ncbi:DUF3800 domain-containing protein [Pectobacterium versatile]|uniref:DUF3800 domain-containing protein n=1 Tax=Pectobacterium versatile TaxID=2488639 RepID=UPI0037F939A4
MVTIYIDESGHSGDMISSGNDFDFQRQPYFSLAGIGLEDSHDWEYQISELRSQHRIPSGELKSKSLISKPKFSADVINTLLDQHVPLFIEIVDKRYFICTHITSFQLLAPCLGYPESADLNSIKNTTADFLYFNAPTHLLNAFVTSCLVPGDSTLLKSFSSLRQMSTQSNYRGSEAQIAQCITHMIEVAESEYKNLNDIQKEPWLSFLPSPDLNKHAKRVWMLPNLTSFTNIYARINRYYGHRLANIRLVHDQQLEVENILRQNKEAAESLHSIASLPYTPNSDYRFEEKATFEFAMSHETIGIQLADIVAGAIMRFFRDVNAGSSISPELSDAVMRIISKWDGSSGCGLNQVVPTNNVININ